jgi:hypothetical protein
MIERVEAEVLDEMRFALQLFWVDLVVEIEDQRDALFDELEGERFLGRVVADLRELKLK